MNDPFSETALTVAAVFGFVAAANALGLSGLVAAAVAGLYFGNITVKQEAYMSLNSIVINQQGINIKHNYILEHI
jgi:NhaP-type Na+/H+ or K+/H+ antiporter